MNLFSVGEYLFQASNKEAQTTAKCFYQAPLLMIFRRCICTGSSPRLSKNFVKVKVEAKFSVVPAFITSKTKTCAA